MPHQSSLLYSAGLVTLTLLGTVISFVSSNHLTDRDVSNRAINLRGSIHIKSSTIIPSKDERVQVSMVAAGGSRLIHDLSRKSCRNKGDWGSAKSRNLISVVRLLDVIPIDNESLNDPVKLSTAETDSELSMLSVSSVIENAVSTELQSSSTLGSNIALIADNAADLTLSDGAAASSGATSVAVVVDNAADLTLSDGAAASSGATDVAVVVDNAADLTLSDGAAASSGATNVAVIVDNAADLTLSDGAAASSGPPDSASPSLGPPEGAAITLIPSSSTLSSSPSVEQPIGTVAEISTDLYPQVTDVAASVVGPTLDADTVLTRTDMPPVDLVVSLPTVEILEEFQPPTAADKTIDVVSSEPTSEFFENAVTFLRSFFDVSTLASYLPNGSPQPAADNDGKSAEFLEGEK